MGSGPSLLAKTVAARVRGLKMTPKKGFKFCHLWLHFLVPKQWDSAFLTAGKFSRACVSFAHWKSFLPEFLTSHNNLYSGCFFHRQSISYASQLPLKKGFSSRFQAMKQEPWNHETAQINLNRKQVVLGDDKDRLLPTLFFEAGEGQLK